MKFIHITRKRLIVLSAALGILLLTAFTAPFSSHFELSKNIDIFVEVIKQLNANYVEDFEPGELVKTGIDAMLRDLDPYTQYIPESNIEDVRFMATGQYGGIGALIHQRDGRIEISDPYRGFPADKAGLRAGDIILEIDGISMKGKTSAEASAILKGQSGTELRLVAERDGKSFEVSITRRVVTIPNIPFKGVLDGDIAYVKLSGFTQEAGREVKEALQEMMKETAVRGVIIDLRGNGGGLLHEAVNITNLFVDQGKLVVTTKGRMSGKDQSYRTLNHPLDPEVPLAILIDEGSASASEIVAGSIQDLDRGVVIGQKSFGKGLVQHVVPLTYNSQLKVTVAHYFIPSGRCIQSVDYSGTGNKGKHIDDSLSTAFRTEAGRTVYDVGGIQPDISIEPEYFSEATATLAGDLHIFDFATLYRLNHDSLPGGIHFRVDDRLYTDFMAFVNERKVTYTTSSEKSLQELRKALEEDGYWLEVKESFTSLSEATGRIKEKDLLRYRDEISLILTAELVSRYHYQEGRIEATLNRDPEIIEAIGLIRDPGRYKSIIQP